MTDDLTRRLRSVFWLTQSPTARIATRLDDLLGIVAEVSVLADRQELRLAIARRVAADGERDIQGRQR